MSKVNKSEVSLFALYKELLSFYNANKGTIKRHYRDLTKKFLTYNDPDGGRAFLRKPQYEALEMYVFLKEFLDNEQMYQIFEDWYNEKNQFELRKNKATYIEEYGDNVQISLGTILAEKEYKSLFNMLKKNSGQYANYIFALTMGTGKTILMATCIFYEFILANKFPKDTKYCHNALVFAPDKTVLEALREIQTFDKRLVVPPEYANLLETHIKFHFLEESGGTLNTTDKSKFNIIISNTQKIILKKQHKEKSSIDKLFTQGKISIGGKLGSKLDSLGLFDFDEDEDDNDNEGLEFGEDVATNQRFEKIRRLEQLGIYVDEAHHLFGNDLKKHMQKNTTKTSLRTTIDELANSLDRSGTRVVACYNFTGTPYIGNQILPEVVYAYGLREAIDNKYLKEVSIDSYENTKSKEFISDVISDFWSKYGDNTYEGMKPKLAIFASTVEEIEKDLKPAVEEVLVNLGVSTNKILVNTGDPKQTSNDDIREFNNLDTVSSDKQFILLVNKGREGWNCRSLFGVALFRKPKSKVFVLQATMRCLRAIGDVQEIGSVYLSKENYDILDEELKSNFRIGIKEVQSSKSKEKEKVKIRPVPPPRKIKIKHVRHEYDIKPRELKENIDFKLDEIDIDKYNLRKTTTVGLNSNNKNLDVKDINDIKDKRKFSKITLVAEISRYLNYSCIKLQKILENSTEGMDAIVEKVNQYNEILYDEIIPRLFNELNEITKKQVEEETEVKLVSDTGVFEVRADKDMIIDIEDTQLRDYKDKSFHVDKYCFDSKPEKTLFMNLLKSKKIKEVYFTGMLTHGQSDFYIQYIDPASHTVRSYYPDFVVKRDDDVWEIVEVKGDHMIDDVVVKAKAEYAMEIASASKMEYRLIKSSDIKD